MDLGTLNEMWTQTGEKLTTFPLSILLDTRLTEATRKFMDTCRFPIAAAPFLEFLDGQNTLPTLSQYYRIDWEGMGNYLVIGYNGSGDPICVDTEATTKSSI